MTKRDIYSYSTDGSFESSWYATVWADEVMLKMSIKGLPFNTVVALDRRAIPQLIRALEAIQREHKSIP